MSLRIAQDAHYQGKNWWRWSVWLDGSPAELDDVSHVVYTLHPTFPTPVRHTDDRSSDFRISSAGWGEFEIFAEVTLKSGETLKRHHWLTLEQPPTKPDQGLPRIKSTHSEVPRKARKRGMATNDLVGSSPPRRAATRGVAPKTETLPLTVFLSGSVGDMPAIRNIRAVLERHGAKVTTAEDIASGLPWEHAIRERIRNADVAVFVLSRRPSLFLMQEIELTLEIGTGLVVPVLIGTEVEPPQQLQGWQAFRVSDDKELETVALDVLKSSVARERG
ncbi:hypothetical protein TVNIR_1743 [Thioalkalivibrio nitratireducens DSM 14787]|uniref:YEATS domain-containing protein n=1 Tax=Thioalkalivibrio nitratireducens (strain DSM 14787 / UNIQEM 213 / ALEN2) TaxID=1255043 RepID=L0DWS9_THIND|nr:pYEATS domain-containing protein [Thioalkalivibrio nitratireducens]AGA33405.1 hypothetical protein TVNIR_1743 [Thioalkalivibrio nitratireducens DSM 14787]